VAQTPKFDKSTSLALFRYHFATTAEYNGWTPGDGAADLISALNEPAALCFPTGATNEGVTAVLENCYGDHHLAEAFHAQVRGRVQHAGKSLQEIAAAIDHLAHLAHIN
jgi:hypothetical protein